MNIDAWFDRFLAADACAQELVAIQQDKRRADETDARRCGNCTKWMKSRICPQEWQDNIKGYQRGPSMNSTAAISCKEFDLCPRVAALKRERLEAVEARLQYLEEHGVPQWAQGVN